MNHAGIAEARPVNALLWMPARNVFPRSKWAEYLYLIEALDEIRELRARLRLSYDDLTGDIRGLERDVRSLGKELIAAIRTGASIEDGGIVRDWNWEKLKELDARIKTSFPRSKWAEYLRKAEVLDEIRETRAELRRCHKLLTRDIRELRMDVRSSRKELIAAIRSGASIEDGGMTSSPRAR